MLPYLAVFGPQFVCMGVVMNKIHHKLNLIESIVFFINLFMCTISHKIVKR